jgi:putative aldouronate transport system substrate-binding protein
MKKTVSLILVILLMMSFASCKSVSEEDTEVTTTGNTAPVTTTNAVTTTTSTSKQETTTVKEENPFEEFMEITWLTQLNADYQEGRWDELELEELFNVDLQVWAMDSRQGEQMAALVAAGDIPDYFFMPGAPRQPADMYNEKLIRSIPLSFFKNYIPGYYELLEKFPIGFSYNLVPGKTDEYLGFTQVDMRGCQYFYDATCINLDWLEAVGYGIDNLQPATQASESYAQYNDNIFFGEGNFSFEEMNDIMRKFTEDDPDGNGIDDTYGMLYMPPNVNESWVNQTQYGLFGFVNENSYLYKDPISGDIVPKYAYTPYRDYYKWISESLTKGYMVSLPRTGTWTTSYSSMSGTGKYGIMSICGVVVTQMNNETNHQYPPMNYLINGDPNARFVVGIMFRGPEGYAVNKTYNIDPFGTGSWRVYMIGEQVSDAKLQRICQILQYTLFSSYENYIRYTSGLEGIHFKWAGDPYLSNMIVTPAAELPPEYRGNTSVFTFIISQSPINQFIRDATIYNDWHYRSWMYVNDLLNKHVISPAKYISDVYMGIELYKEYTDLVTKYPEINTVVNDFINRALEGMIDNFNTEWQQYIEQLYSAGLEEIIEKIFNNPEFKDYDPGQKFILRE